MPGDRDSWESISRNVTRTWNAVLLHVARGDPDLQRRVLAAAQGDRLPDARALARASELCGGAEALADRVEREQQRVHTAALRAIRHPWVPRRFHDPAVWPILAEVRRRALAAWRAGFTSRPHLRPRAPLPARANPLILGSEHACD